MPDPAELQAPTAGVRCISKEGRRLAIAGLVLWHYTTELASCLTVSGRVGQGILTDLSWPRVDSSGRLGQGILNVLSWTQV